MVVLDLACSGELELVYLQAGGGGARVMVNGRQECLATYSKELDSKVSFYSRMKPLVDNLL